MANKLYVSHAREKFRERTKKLKLGQYVNALYINTYDPSYYEKRLRYNRYDARALYYLGQRYEKEENWEQALHYYKQAVQAEPHYEAAIGALILLQRKQEERFRKLASQATRRRPVRKKMSLLQMVTAIFTGYFLILMIVFGILLR